MAANIGSLLVSMRVDLGPFQQGMARAAAVTDQAANRINRSAGVAQNSVNAFNRSVGGQTLRPYGMIAVSRAFDNANDRAQLLRGSMLALTGIFGGFGAAISTNLVLRYADTYTKLTNQIRAVSESADQTTVRFAALASVADRSRSSLEATSILYARIQKASPERSAEEILQYVETIQKALALGGATAQEARSAAIQFSQAIASNRLGGEELRAILETPLGLELAKGLGVTIGKFREMGHAGELTADKVLEALKKVRGSVNEAFANSVVTIDQAVSRLDNRLTVYISNLDASYGGTRLLTGAIAGLANNLDTIMPIIGYVGAGLATIFARRWLSNGIVGRSITNTFSELKAGWDRATEAAATYTQEATAARQQLLNTAIAANRARQMSQQDPVQFAASRERRDYESALAAQNRYIAGQQRLKEINRALNSSRTPASEAHAMWLESDKITKAMLVDKKKFADIDALHTAAVVSGQRAIRAEVQRTAQEHKNAATSLELVTEKSNRATRATTAWGRAMTFGRSAMYGIFGGPWGLAITAIITALGIWAAKQAKVNAAIEEGIKAYEDLANKDKDKTKRDTETFDLADARQRMAEIEKKKAELQALFAPTVGMTSQWTSSQQFDSARVFNQIKQGLLETGGDVEKFKQKIEDLRKSDPSMGPLLDELVRISKALQGLRLRAEATNKEIDLLANRKIDPAAWDALARADVDAMKQRKKTLDDYKQEQKDLAEIRKAEAAGDEAKARGIKNYIAAYQEYIKTNGQSILLSKEEYIANARSELSHDKRVEAIKRANREAEAFTEKLKRMREEAQGSFLGDLDREVVQTAREMKASAKDIQAYVDAVKSGNFQGVNPKIMELRDIKLMQEAGKQARGIVEEYGNWEQIMPLLRERQEALNRAVASGAITADQAQAAMAKYLTTFGNYKWIEDASRAFTDFLGDAVTGTKSWTEALEDLRKAIVKIALEELALRPIRDMLRGGLSWFTGFMNSGGGSGGGSFVDPWVGMRASGGLAGEATIFKKIPGFAEGGSLRGIGSGKSDSNLIWASNGEYIVNATSSSRYRDLLDAINAGNIRVQSFVEGDVGRSPVFSAFGERAAAAGVAQPVEVHVHKVPANMDVKTTQTQKPGGGFRLDIELQREIDRMTAANIQSRNSSTNRAIEQTYRTDPTRGIG